MDHDQLVNRTGGHFPPLPTRKAHMKTLAHTITAKLATPQARAMNRDMARAMEALDAMPTATLENRTAHADAVDRFMELADRYDVLIYGPVTR